MAIADEELKKEALVKCQALHDIIEKHPYLSGMMTDQFHSFLNFVARHGWMLDGYERSELMKQPSEEDVEKYL